MNCNVYKYMLSFLILTGSCLVADTQKDMPPVASADAQAQFNAMMSMVYDLIMPDYKHIYKKYYQEIEWVEHNYVIDVENGNKVLDIIAHEFHQLLVNKLDAILDFLALHNGYKLSSQERETFKNIMIQVMPSLMVQGLMKHAELKSTVYQEILAEQN